MRILYHHRTQAGDAQGIHIAEMVRAFRRLGHEVEMVSLVGEGGGTAHDAGATSPWAWVRRAVPAAAYEAMTLTYNAWGYGALAGAIRRRRPDVIYERYALNTVCGVWASRRFGVPLVLEVNAPLAAEQEALGEAAFRRLARRSERWICSNATRTLVVSAALGRRLVESGVPADALTVMPNGVDPERFHPAVDASPVRQRHRLDGRLVVGFVGWFRAWHGLEELIDLFAKRRLAERGVTLMLVGDGPCAAALRARVAALRLAESVVFTGPVATADVPAHVAAFDVAVQPSAPDYACPMKIVEYMAMGRAIVAPDQPNVRELLDAGVTARLFAPGDRASFEAALLDLIDDAATREGLARRAGAAVVERGLTWTANAERTLALAAGAGHAPGARGASLARAGAES